MFISSDIPNAYNRIAELHDNYVILVKEQLLSSNNSYDAYVQFFSPSTEVLHLTNYKITDGTNKTYNYHYVNTQYYSYIDYVDVSYTKNTYLLDNVSNNLFDRHDIASIGLLVGLLMALVIIIVNLATSLIHRGGIFHA